jgi:drug/metabolite transporter (DMT)-like permease
MVLPTLDEQRPVVVVEDEQDAGAADSATATESDPLLQRHGRHVDVVIGDDVVGKGDEGGEEGSDDSAAAHSGSVPSPPPPSSWWERVEEAVQESAETFQQGVIEQVREVAGAIRDELRQVEDDDKFFLEMGLARNLSILPGDVVDVAHAATATTVMMVHHPHEGEDQEGEDNRHDDWAMTTTTQAEAGGYDEIMSEEWEKPSGRLDEGEEPEAVLIPEDLTQSVEFLAGLTRRFSLRRSASSGGGSMASGRASWLGKRPSSIGDDEHPTAVGNRHDDDAATTTTTTAVLTPTLAVVLPPRVVNAYVLLATAVVSLSSIGPFLQLQRDCTPAMKVTWRTCGTACLLFPLCVAEVRRYGLRSAVGGGEQEPLVSVPKLVTFLLSTVSYVVMVMGFVLALQYTAVGNAVILSNSQALLLLAGKVAMGSPVTPLEGSGALTAFCGAVFCSLDSAAAATQSVGKDVTILEPDDAYSTSATYQDDVRGSSSTVYLDGRLLYLISSSGVPASDVDDGTAPSTVRGDAFALLSGLGGVGYLVCAKAVRMHMKLYTFMFATMAVACFLCVAAQVLLLDETVTLSLDLRVGLFGFLTPVGDRLYVEILIVAVCNMLGTLGYVRAMQYFDNLVISVASLMEPVVAELMAAVMGVSTLPGPMGWLGNALVALGTFAVVYPTPGKAASGSH